MLTLTALVFSMTLVVLQPVPVRGRSHGKERMVGSRRLDGPARTDLDEVYRRNDLLGAAAEHVAGELLHRTAEHGPARPAKVDRQPPRDGGAGRASIAQWPR